MLPSFMTGMLPSFRQVLSHWQCLLDWGALRICTSGVGSRCSRSKFIIGQNLCFNTRPAIVAVVLRRTVLLGCPAILASC